jgi:hypothetical protein
MDSQRNTSYEDGRNYTNASKLWLGVAVGVAVGIGIALSRRRKSRWEQARDVTRQVVEQSPDFAEVSLDIVQHVRNICEEGLKVVEEAGELWANGRKLAGY